MSCRCAKLGPKGRRDSDHDQSAGAAGHPRRGNLIVDLVKYIDRYPPPETLASIEGTEASLGGLGCNVALSLAQLAPELPLELIGVVGEDALAERILTRLEAHPSIDCRGLRRAGETAYTDVMTEPDGRRTFYHFRGANALLGPEDIVPERTAMRILHVGYILLLDALDAPDPDYPSAVCRVLDRAQRAGMITSVDVISEASDRYHTLVRPALAYVDICCINDYEAERTTGIELRDGTGAPDRARLRACCEALLELGVARWAVIHSREMSCGMTRDGDFEMQPAWQLPEGYLRSTVGAGDAFAAGLLYAVHEGWTLAEALHTAGAVAAHSLAGAGGADAIRPLGEMMARMEAFQRGDG